MFFRVFSLHRRGRNAVRSRRRAFNRQTQHKGSAIYEVNSKNIWIKRRKLAWTDKSCRSTEQISPLNTRNGLRVFNEFYTNWKLLKRSTSLLLPSTWSDTVSDRKMPVTQPWQSTPSIGILAHFFELAAVQLNRIEQDIVTDQFDKNVEKIRQKCWKNDKKLFQLSAWILKLKLCKWADFHVDQFTYTSLQI